MTKQVITDKASTTIYHDIATGKMHWIKRGPFGKRVLQQEWEIAYGDRYEYVWRDIPTEVLDNGEERENVIAVTGATGTENNRGW